jgi:hypothetical protein
MNPLSTMPISENKRDEKKYEEERRVRLPLPRRSTGVKTRHGASPGATR